MLIPAIPFAFVIGVAVTEAQIGPVTGWSSAPIIYAGAGQLTLITLLGSGAAWAAAVTAALVVNARHAMYSVALAPTFQRQPAWFRWVGSYLLIDQVFVLAERRKNDPPAAFRRYYLGVGLSFCVLWFLFIALGLVLGPVVPTGWGLEFAVPVMFTGMLIPGLDSSPKWVAVLVAAVVTVACAGLPNRAGLLVGAVAGIVAGVLADRRRA
ncbi:branched-chain amino acid permease [Nocardioides albidus]|uniref:Branched-chain amino acid permease n=2 Tax=Nocardioides albidus TaxID=1517589 RepID=A0A5C4WLE2_9ACTN|nr:branched-chain amino acid permease [Nocardioides albidus]